MHTDYFLVWRNCLFLSINCFVEFVTISCLSLLQVDFLYLLFNIKLETHWYITVNNVLHVINHDWTPVVIYFKKIMQNTHKKWELLKEMIILCSYCPFLCCTYKLCAPSLKDFVIVFFINQTEFCLIYFGLDERFFLSFILSIIFTFQTIICSNSLSPNGVSILFYLWKLQSSSECCKEIVRKI